MANLGVHALAGVRLTEHDYVVKPGEPQPALTEFALPWAMGVDVHVNPDTPIVARVYELPQQSCVSVGVYPAEVKLFLSADQVDRLINVLTATKLRLIEGR